MKYKIIVTPRSFPIENESIRQLWKDSQCEIIRITQKDADFQSILKEQITTADAVIAGLEEYDEALIASAKNLKVISRYGVGSDKIDLKAANQRNIKVTVTPNANTESVADMAFALLLGAARSIPFSDRSLRNGETNRPVGFELWGKTLGVAGLGRIGKAVVRRALGFNMKVCCNDIYEDREFAQHYPLTYCDFDTLLKQSDFISIHLPMTPKTEHLFNKKSFDQMKRTAILVNTSRGGIINEEDLYQALTTHTIHAAGLDVTAHEPPLDSKLLTLDNCVVTNHLGATTREAIDRMGMMATQNALDVLAGKDNAYIVKLVHDV